MNIKSSLTQLTLSFKIVSMDLSEINLGGQTVLEKAEVGKMFKVLELEGNDESIKKLQAMGIREGKVLEVVQKFGRNIVVKVDNFKVAISKCLAKKIKVA